MAVGPAIFQSAGQRTEHYVPGAYSRSTAEGGSGDGVSANRGVILGQSKGGKPHELFTFSSVEEAKETLVGGDLLRAVAHAFNPSPEYSPQAIRAMVVNGNTQAASVMTAGGDAVLNLKSSGYGIQMNQLKRQLADGTNPGTKKIIFALGDNKETIDNIGKKSISLQYTGAGSAATVTIDNTGLAVTVTGETADSITLSFEDFPTIDEMAARLNDTGKFAAVRLDPESNIPSNELDAVSNQDVKTAVAVLKSDFYALFHALESSIYVGKGNVEKEAGAQNTLPDNDPDPVYFEGASAGTYTVNDWADALGALEAEDIQIVSTPSTDHAVHTLISNHCTAMSNVQNRKERTAFVGGQIGEMIEDAIAFAATLNNKLVSYCYPAITAASPLTGEAEDLPASYFACKLLGMECTVAVNEPLTWKSVSVLKFLKKLKTSEMEKLIIGGVLCGGTTEDNRLAVIRAMTTYQGRQLQLVERSMVREDLYMNRDIRLQYSTGVGRPGIDKVSDAEKTLQDAAREWKGEGLIIPRDDGQNIWGVRVRKSGDKTIISFNRNLTAPQNFFFITAYNYVYESETSIEV
jgi:hypothetical protein